MIGGVRVKIVVDYASWSLFSYSQDRFTFAKPETLQSLLTRTTIDSAHELCSNTIDVINSTFAQNIKNTLSKSQSIEQYLLTHGLHSRLAQFPDLVHFLMESQLPIAMKVFQHTMEYNEAGKPLILVNGRLKPLTHVMQNMRIEYKADSGKIPLLIEKRNSAQWQYLGQGLTTHNMLTDFTPMSKNAPSNSHTISFYCTNHGNTTSAGGIKRLLASHSWLRLQDKEGNVYSAGKLCQGAILSPDPFEFRPYPKIKATFPISEEQFSAIKRVVSETMMQGKDSYHLLSKNCSTFTGKIAHMLFPQASPSSELKEHNTLGTRIKIFKVFQMLAEFFHTHFSRSMTYIEEHLFVYIRQATGEYGEWIANKLIEISAFIPSLKSLFKTLIQECSTSYLHLMNKLYNFITDLFTACGNQKIDHPYSLFLQLKKMPQAIIGYEPKK